MWCWRSYSVFWFLIPLAVDAGLKHYNVNYGDDLGNATLEFDSTHRYATIKPTNATRPATVMDFKKGIVVYVTTTECMLSKLRANEGHYEEEPLNTAEQTVNPTLFVSGEVSQHKAKRLLGDHFTWCANKPIFWLSFRRPKLPTHKFHLKSHRGVDSQILEQENPEEDLSHQSGHQRFKRRAKREKRKKERKNKSKKRQGKDKKSKKKKNKKNKRPKTKSLKTGVQQLSVKAPRISFPAALGVSGLTEEMASVEETGDHVVLQEEPYLSPSYTRTSDDGQRFKHYRDFYQEPSRNNSTYTPGHVSRIISHDTSDPVDGEEGILIPETIVKDGQIFYRHDADESTTDSPRGQTKRSHTREEDSPLDYQFDYHNDSGDSFYDETLFTDDSILHDTDYGMTDHRRMDDPGFSHAHTQAQMDDRTRSALAGALSSLGSGTQAQGHSGLDGFFIAQAHSVGHPSGERTSSAKVFGNTHGVQGVAMTAGKGHQSHVQVDMGAHPSSTAHVAMQGGSATLSSSVHATQTGGRAGAHAHGDGTSSSNAHMEFNPSTPYQRRGSGLRGQGSASATVTDTGGSLLTSLSGEVSAGAYLGTAHSSIDTNPASSSDSGNTTWGIQDFISHEFEQPNPVIDGTIESTYQHENLTHGRQTFDELPFHIDHFGEISSYSRHDSLPVTDHHKDPTFSEHTMEGQMLSNIMETVHQPDMTPEFIPYPVGEPSIIDEEGLTGGAGLPPRESEIEQAPIGVRGHHQEGRGLTSDSKAGVVGLATYSHGRLGAPPGPGELLYYDQYDYNYDDSDYRASYFDEYADGASEDDDDIPLIDLGPEIEGFVPLESNFENFEPVQLEDFGQPRIETPLPPSQEQDEHYSYDYTPEPLIPVHRDPAPTDSPRDTSVSGESVPHVLPHDSSSSKSSSRLHEGEYYEREHTEYSTISPLPYLSPSTTTHVPNIETTRPSPPYESVHESHIPDYAQEVVPQNQRTTILSSVSQNETHLPIVSQEVPQTHMAPLDRQSFTRTHGRTPQNIQPQITSGMTGMSGTPLDPGNPGSVRYLPGSEGRPDLKVMSVSATDARQSSSLLSHRTSTSLQPGQNIPGAPGYKVPPGFRGHVILGDGSPVTTDSRRVVEGFNTRVRVAPQYPSSGSPVYTSVGGPGTSSQIRSQEDARGVHITLGGGMPERSKFGHAATSQRMTMHPGMQSQVPSVSAAMTSQVRQNGMLPRKSWDGRRRGTMTGESEDCGYYSMKCESVFGPNGRSQVCQPVLIAVACCC